MKKFGNGIYIGTTQEFERKGLLTEEKYIYNVGEEIINQVKDRVLMLVPDKENLLEKFKNSVIVYDTKNDKVVGNFSKRRYDAYDFGLDGIVDEVVNFESFILNKEYRGKGIGTHLFKEAVNTEKRTNGKLLTVQTLNFKVFKSGQDNGFNLVPSPKIPLEDAINALEDSGLKPECIENNLIFMTNTSMLCSQTKRNVEYYLKENGYNNSAHCNFPYRQKLLFLSKKILNGQFLETKQKEIFKKLFSKVGYIMNEGINKNLYWTDEQFKILTNYK